MFLYVYDAARSVAQLSNDKNKTDKPSRSAAVWIAEIWDGILQKWTDNTVNTA